MSPVMIAIGRAARDLARPRVLAVLVLPMTAAILLWAILAFVFWDAWVALIQRVVEGTSLARSLNEYGARSLVEGMGVLVVIVLLIPAILITALVLTELLAMPAIIAVAQSRYGALEKRRGGTTVGSLANAAVAASLFAVLWLVCLPLWLTGIGAFVLPALNSAYLNQRVFRYEALAEHASDQEYRELVRRNKGRLFGLGLAVAPLYYVPLVNLAAPVVAGLAFTHFCLAELSRLRTAGG